MEEGAGGANTGKPFFKLTTTDFCRWLLDHEMTHLIPYFIQNNVSGAMLMDVDFQNVEPAEGASDDKCNDLNHFLMLSNDGGAADPPAKLTLGRLLKARVKFPGPTRADLIALGAHLSELRDWGANVNPATGARPENRDGKTSPAAVHKEERAEGKFPGPTRADLIALDANLSELRDRGDNVNSPTGARPEGRDGKTSPAAEHKEERPEDNPGYDEMKTTQFENVATDLAEAPRHDGSDQTDEMETYWRLLDTSGGTPTGWSFEREKTEWLDAMHLHVEITIAEHMLSDLKIRRQRLSVAVLIVSSMTTLLTSVHVVNLSGGEKELEDTDVGVSRGYFLMIFSKSITLLVLSFITTLLSGYSQLQASAWKEREEACQQYVNVAQLLHDFLVEQLSLCLEDRLPYHEFQREKREKRKAMKGSRNLDISPSQRMLAVKRVRDRDAESWNHGFEWLGEKLIWPIDAEDVVAMLMEFSREELGEHTLSRTDSKRYQRYTDTWKERKKAYFLEHSLGGVSFREQQREQKRREKQKGLDEKRREKQKGLDVKSRRASE